MIMLLPSIVINKKFFNLIWFLFIVNCYNSIFFLKIPLINFFQIIDNIDNKKIFYKIFHFGLNGVKINYFNFLKGKFYLLYSSEFMALVNSIPDKSHLFAISYYGSFVNPSYFFNIININLFYENNYLYFIFSSSWFLIMYKNIIRNLFIFFSFRIVCLVGWILALYKALPQILFKVCGYNNNVIEKKQ